MFTRTFQPEISEKDIRSVLRMDVGEGQDVELAGFSEEKRKHRLGILRGGFYLLLGGGILLILGRLFRGDWLGNLMIPVGVLFLVFAPFHIVIRLVRSVTSVSQKDPKKVMKAFITEVFSFEPDYGRAYELIAPPISKDITVEMFAERWKDVFEDMRSEVKYQETASCKGCEQEFSGLWSDRGWRLTDDKLKKNELMLRCENCQVIYCSTCYLGTERKGGLIKKRYCPNCNTKMEDQALEIFQSKPDVVRDGLGRLDELLVDYDQNERIAHLKAKVTSNYKVRKIIPPTGLTEDNFDKLGDKGTVVCNFSNMAVKVGEKWYLVAALPDTISTN